MLRHRNYWNPAAWIYISQKVANALRKICNERQQLQKKADLAISRKAAALAGSSVITACAICLFLQQAELLRPQIMQYMYVVRMPSQIGRSRGLRRSNQQLQRGGRGSESICTFHEFIAACRLLLCEMACRLLTAWPARRSAAVDVTYYLLPRPYSASIRSARPAADRFDWRPDRGCRLRRCGGDFRAALLLRMMVDEPIRCDHRRAMVAVALR